uniref:Chitin synthase n=1 Tax=Nannizzia persicolor TaxID=65487 RepID=O13291_9EURO|nr:chitin synthase 1 [Nannizzia persicolor]
MYNEDEFLFARTMAGVFKNIEYMCSRTSSKTWGKEAWKKIVVCIVSDGCAKINARTRAVLAGLGVYQDGIAKQQVNGKDVTAHIYEYTTQIGMEVKGTQVLLKPRPGIRYSSFSVSRRRTRRRSTLTDGSSRPLVVSSIPTSVFSSTPEQNQAGRYIPALACL